MTTYMHAQSDRRAAFIDLILIIGALLISKSLLLKVDAIWTYAGPISLLFAMGVAIVCLRRRGEGLASVGLKRPPALSWRCCGL